PVPDSSFLRDP
uniref:Extended FMRFamide-10 n=1 Tax=Striatophasma naukluftense TaxID=1041429 RepID=FAR10_STRNA|nr:RecName: Full=Extended FMRFamide-10; Short=FMRFa-10 [Striatophasma naukluftense]